MPTGPLTDVCIPAEGLDPIDSHLCLKRGTPKVA